MALVSLGTAALLGAPGKHRMEAHLLGKHRMEAHLLAKLRSCQDPLVGQSANSTPPEVLSAARKCAERALLQLLTVPTNRDVIDYFYDAPAGGQRFRLAACVHAKMRKVTHDYIWSADPGSKEPCFWGNMLYSKSVFIILFARLLGVSHIIESGRMGAMSLVHYHHFGFNLTSVEYMPIPDVSRALAQHLPSVRLLDGDGSVLVPRAISEIHASDPAARILAIIDGPKGVAALRLANSIAARVAAVVLDDQEVAADRYRQHQLTPALNFYTLNELWISALPRERDYELSPMNKGGRGTTSDHQYFFYPTGATALWSVLR
eukprot:CAMPEP_0185285688 /NCGR_PEP_ID=MMETSP1363-20130426/1871_1 /TAXON_ID=38817 /ORGANISM="Gephyrocapsa oceanica, Strain RCC1303" /LENGTH=318 /DNA_ID=CAMNT_0027881479 /DNA_START=35 /DNA_END=991 /DNA_ORIENTATION=+